MAREYRDIQIEMVQTAIHEAALAAAEQPRREPIELDEEQQEMQALLAARRKRRSKQPEYVK